MAKTRFGKVCAKHPELKGERYLTSSGGHCLACAQEYCRERRAADPEKHREYGRQQYAADLDKGRDKCRRWYTANAEQVGARQRQWRRGNLDKLYAAAREWRRDNAPLVNARNARRRALRKAQQPQLTAIERAQYQEFHDLARARTAQTGVKWTVDHDRPLALGGADHPSNLMLLPASANFAKGAKYASTLAFLTSDKGAAHASKILLPL